MMQLYNALREKISGVDFHRLWPGFKPFKFALYDEKNVYFGENVFAKDERFIGNTAIIYNGEHIAIWDAGRSPVDNLDIFAAKIIHEMFHAFQNLKKEKRWADEIAGLNYNYARDNLNIKYKENELLKALHDNFTAKKFEKFLALREYRRKHFSGEFEYETKIESIEGIANYVELMALKQLNSDKYLKAVDVIKSELVDIGNLIPIRKICYHTGALLLLICNENNISFFHHIGETEKTVFELLAREITAVEIDIENSAEIDALIRNYRNRNENLLNNFLNNHPCRLEGEYKIYGFDPMNTVKHENYLYCRHFLAYIDNGEVKFVRKQCAAEVDERFNMRALYW